MLTTMGATAANGDRTMTDRLDDTKQSATEALARLKARLQIAEQGIIAATDDAGDIARGSLSVALGALERATEDGADAASAVSALASAARDLVWPSVTVDLPKVAVIEAAVGSAVSLRTAYNWFAGATCPPAWAVVAIADHIGVDAGALARAFDARWRSAQREAANG